MIESTRRIIVAGPVRSQSLAPAGPTLLHLDATGTVQAVPDLLVARLVAEARSTDPATAQRQVNRSIEGATAKAGTVGGLTWRLQDCAVEHDEATPRQWSARQTLVLQGQEAAAALGLKVGRIRDVKLDDVDGPRPMMRVMARLSAPETTRDGQDVSRKASADIELHP